MTYGGDISPVDCWKLLQSDNTAVLVDVRTRAEWAYIGAPALDAGMNAIIGQEWQIFPDMRVDENFDQALKSQLQRIGASLDAKLCFLCRSGVRSLAAARSMTAAGYPNTYNVTGGFEGDLDAEGHRGQVNGWKADGLSWQQG